MIGDILQTIENKEDRKKAAKKAIELISNEYPRFNKRIFLNYCKLQKVD